MKNMSIVILLISLLFTGCSSAKQKEKSFFSKDQQAELKGILDRHLTDQDWDRYQQAIDSMKEKLDKKKLNIEYNIDLRNDYDKDMQILMILAGASSDKPILQKELMSFMNKIILDKIPAQGEKK